jgi:uncharacterized protein YndB with AHSA1/START domain
MAPRKNKKATGRSSTRVLVLTRIFAAPRHLVFEAWTKSRHLKQGSAPNGFSIPVSKGDVRVGGAWRACMRTPEGENLWLSGIYREVVPDERLVFTHAWEEDGKPGHETLVTVTFANHGRKTKMNFRQEGFESVQSRDGHRDGWNESLDRLAELLAKLGRPSALRAARPSIKSSR